MRTSFAVFTLSVVLSPALFAQRVSFGFVGGTNLTNDYPLYRTIYVDDRFPSGLTASDAFSATHSFIWGISAELHFARGFSLEGNALHRNLNLEGRYTFPDGSQLYQQFDTKATWEYPVLLKYRAPALGLVRPFIEGGPSFRTRSIGIGEPSQFGGTIGIGGEFRTGHLRISPVIRYTRWQYDGPFPRLATKQDQIEFLTGISYATSVPSWRVGGRKLRFGLIGGTPFTGGLGQRGPFSGAPVRIEERQGYIAGLVGEVELSSRFSVEVNGLYRPFRADTVRTVMASPGFPELGIPATPAHESRGEFTVLTWQFPVLAKYRFQPQSSIRPVIEGGSSFRLSGNTNGYDPSLLGVTAGIGLETDFRAMKISPVVRYTRWTEDPNRLRETRPNQIEFLVSFTF